MSLGNKPYVKQITADGELLNPIIGYYSGRMYIQNEDPEQPGHFVPNRRERRSAESPGRRISNKKGIKLVVSNFGRGIFQKTEKRITPKGHVNYILR